LIKDFKVFAETSGNIIIFESATVLEKTQFAGFGDKVILVDAPFELRLERACKRDGAGRDAVLARMKGQKLMNALSSGLSDERIDEIIINNGSVDDLEVAVKGVMDRFGLADIKNN
jgi:dephospho-CoA kinase